MTAKPPAHPETAREKLVRLPERRRESAMPAPERGLLAALPMGIAVVRGGRIAYANAACERLFDCAAGELPGTATRRLHPDDDSAAQRARLEAPPPGSPTPFEGYFRRRDESLFWCRVTATPIGDADAPAALWQIEDASARHAETLQLRQVALEQRLILEHALVGIVFLKDSLVHRCNARMSELFGYPPEELLGGGTEKLFATPGAWAEAGKRLFDRGRDRDAEPVDAVLEMTRKGGESFLCHVVGRRIDIGDRSDSWIWIFDDVTAQENAHRWLVEAKNELEQRVRERTAQLAQTNRALQDQLHFVTQMIDAFPSPIYFKDPLGRYLGCNNAFVEYLGVAREQLIGKTAADHLPPDLADAEHAGEARLLDAPGSAAYDLCIRHIDGSLRDVAAYKATFHKADGRLGGIVGMFVDISERKRTEQAMREHGERLRLYFDLPLIGMARLSLQHGWLEVNDKLCAILGHTRAELLATPWSQLSYPEDAGIDASLFAALLRGERDDYEVDKRLLRRDGKPVYVQLTVRAVRAATGRIDYLVLVVQDITERKLTQEMLDYQARHDPLTDLPNRLMLEDRLTLAIERARRSATALAVLFVDLDRFKVINDTLGHPVGDLVLKETATRIEAVVRGADTVARLGGDEFIVLLEEMRSEHDASLIADKILADLHLPVMAAGQEFFVSASIGISLFPRDGEDAPVLIRNADTAMYRAKERGRDSYAFYSADLTASAVERFALETGLRRAIEREEFELHYQPQFSLAEGRLVGAEALLRWRHPEHGMVPPGTFIPLAEETGLIEPIGRWALLTVCRQQRRWLAEGRDAVPVAVNISEVQIHRGELLSTVAHALHETGIPPRLLELEITEGFILRQAEQRIRLLRDLRALGVRLAIDDFGTGYSSLSYLKRLPIDKLKIDQSFVRGLPDDADDAAIARAVIALGHSLGLKVIAEGVETEAQETFLYDAGCEELQGFLRSRPLTAGIFASNFLRRPPP